MADLDAERSRSNAGTSKKQSGSGLRSDKRRVKQTTFTVTPRRRLNTASSVTRPRPSDCTKSLKIVSKSSAKTTVQPLIPEQLVPKGPGLLVTE